MLMGDCRSPLAHKGATLPHWVGPMALPAYPWGARSVRHGGGGGEGGVGGSGVFVSLRLCLYVMVMCATWRHGA